MRIAVVIPARLSSRRLPDKVLAEVAGRPLLWHVWRNACDAPSIDRVYVATDEVRIQQQVASWGGISLRTPASCASGTERVASVLEAVDGELIINLQADEPLVGGAVIEAMVAAWRAMPSEVITPVYRIGDIETLGDPNVVKVVRGTSGHALYFSRSPIPWVRDHPPGAWLGTAVPFWGHVGAYGYRREALVRHKQLPASPLEQAERLEQLRFLAGGWSVNCVEIDHRPISVDTADDLEQVRKILGAPR